MRKALFPGLLLGLLTQISAASGSPWGRDYFPNTRLISQSGEEKHFFDDLIADKIVAINFIYTSCPDVCPLETAQLVRVQNILGERLGQDIHFYSISIDPATDTPDVLEQYRERFGARWDFFTGDRAQIIELRRKLGLYIEDAERQKNLNNHNISMIIGNQKTGRWMKRSPFENPYVLADQIGNWLDGWKSPQQEKDYAQAPTLRPLVRGEPLFRTRCSSCHSTDGNTDNASVGPDLNGVTQRRDREWLMRWIQRPDRMIEDKDPIALALLRQYKDIAMPNLRLNAQEAADLIDYLAALAPAEPAQTGRLTVRHAWIRDGGEKARTLAGFMELHNAGPSKATLIGAKSSAFDSVEIHTMESNDGLMMMKKLDQLELAPGQTVLLQSGAKHLMLKQRLQAIVTGDQIGVTLQFADGSMQDIQMAVKNELLR